MSTHVIWKDAVREGVAMQLDMVWEFLGMRDPDIGNRVFLENREGILAFVKQLVACGLAAVLRIGLLLPLLDALNDLVLEHHLAEHHRVLVQVLAEGWRADVRVVQELRRVERVSADDEGLAVDMLLLSSLEVLHLNRGDLFHPVFFGKMQLLGQCLS